MCDVPSTAVFCSESIEWFPGIVSKFFFKLLVTIPVAPIITGTIVHFMFHIRCISIYKLLSFNLFSFPFAQKFVCGFCRVFQCACFLLFVSNYYMWLICFNFSVCVYSLFPQHCDISLFTHWLRHVYVPFVWFLCLRLCILSSAKCIQTLIFVLIIIIIITVGNVSVGTLFIFYCTVLHFFGDLCTHFHVFIFEGRKTFQFVVRKTSVFCICLELTNWNRSCGK